MFLVTDENMGLCLYILPKGQKFKIPINLPNIVTGDSNLYSLLKVFPSPINLTIATLVTEETFLSRLSLDDINTPTWDEFSHAPFHQAKSMPFTTQFCLVTIMLLIISLVLKCIYRQSPIFYY